MSAKSPISAIEVAILAQAIPLQRAAELIEQYAQTVASAAQLDIVAETYNRVDRVLAEAATSREPVR